MCTFHHGFVLLVLFEHRWLQKHIVVKMPNPRPTQPQLFTLFLAFRGRKVYGLKLVIIVYIIIRMMNIDNRTVMIICMIMYDQVGQVIDSL